MAVYSGRHGIEATLEYVRELLEEGYAVSVAQVDREGNFEVRGRKPPTIKGPGIKIPADGVERQYFLQ